MFGNGVYGVKGHFTFTGTIHIATNSGRTRNTDCSLTANETRGVTGYILKLIGPTEAEVIEGILITVVGVVLCELQIIGLSIDDGGVIIDLIVNDTHRG